MNFWSRLLSEDVKYFNLREGEQRNCSTSGAAVKYYGVSKSAHCGTQGFAEEA